MADLTELPQAGKPCLPSGVTDHHGKDAFEVRFGTATLEYHRECGEAALTLGFAGCPMPGNVYGVRVPLPASERQSGWVLPAIHQGNLGSSSNILTGGSGRDRFLWKEHCISHL